MPIRGFGRFVIVFLSATGIAAASGPGLIEAVKNSDAAGIRTLLSQGTDVNAADVDGTTALHWAVHRNDAAAVELLLKAGASAAVRNRYGVPPLSLASTNGHAVIVEMLLKAGADANAALSEGETALLTAARTGNADTVKALLAHAADVHAKETWRGQTALMWAAAEGHHAAVTALLEAGARIDDRSKTGYTALMFAARAGDLEGIQLLLDAGANVNAVQDEGAGPLALAIHNAHFEAAARLLDRSADQNLDKPGYTALHLVVHMRSLDIDAVPAPIGSGELDSLALIEALLRRGANPNAQMTAKQFVGIRSPVHLTLPGATPFLLAAKGADVPAMRLLLAAGGDPLIKTMANATALMAAAGLGYAQGHSPGAETEALEAVKLTHDLGVDVNAVDASGYTAMHGAAIRGANTIVTFLAEKGAKLDVKNKKGQLPLTLATEGDGSNSNINEQPQTARLLRELMGIPTPGAGAAR